jgi:kinesin family protein 18/19
MQSARSRYQKAYNITNNGSEKSNNQLKSPRPPAIDTSSHTNNNSTTSSNFTVAVRVRPLNKLEDNGSEHSSVLEVFDESLIVLKDPKQAAAASDPLFKSRECKFAFDFAFPPECTQQHIYSVTGQRVIPQVLQGLHCTIFAYGATGSGKTHTMAGTEETPGIVYSVISDLFEAIQKAKVELNRAQSIKVTASYLEIYNEAIYDLLNMNNNTATGKNSAAAADLREDAVLGVIVSGVERYEMNSKQAVYDLIVEGQAHRTTDSHLLNQSSSRSHSILQLVIEHLDNGKTVRCSNLNLIDLAGSERAKKTNTSKKMLAEGAKINRSLLALANCINALTQSNKKGLHIPYRDSKLTRLLKDSLRGAAVCIMIACVSPSATQFEESRETLLYANRAKSIKVDQAALEAQRRREREINKEEYEKLVADLRSELQQLRSKLATGHPSPRLVSARPNPVLKTGGSTKNEAAQQQRNSHESASDSVENYELNDLLRRIITTFQDQIQMHRSLAEIDETRTANERAVELYKKKMRESALNSTEYEFCCNECKAFELAMDDNDRYRHELVEMLASIEGEQQEVQAKIEALSVKNRSDRDLIELTYERCEIELQKTESELQVRIYANLAQEKDLEAQYYLQLLQSHNIQFKPFSIVNFTSTSDGSQIPTSLAVTPLPLTPRLLNTSLPSPSSLNSGRNSVRLGLPPVAASRPISSATRTLESIASTQRSNGAEGISPMDLMLTSPGTATTRINNTGNTGRNTLGSSNSLPSLQGINHLSNDGDLLSSSRKSSESIISPRLLSNSFTNRANQMAISSSRIASISTSIISPRNPVSPQSLTRPATASSPLSSSTTHSMENSEPPVNPSSVSPRPVTCNGPLSAGSPLPPVCVESSEQRVSPLRVKVAGQKNLTAAASQPLSPLHSLMSRLGVKANANFSASSSNNHANHSSSSNQGNKQLTFQQLNPLTLSFSLLPSASNHGVNSHSSTAASTRRPSRHRSKSPAKVYNSKSSVNNNNHQIMNGSVAKSVGMKFASAANTQAPRSEAYQHKNNNRGGAVESIYHNYSDLVKAWEH